MTSDPTRGRVYTIAQLRQTGMLQCCELLKHGYPTRITYAEVRLTADCRQLTTTHYYSLLDTHHSLLLTAPHCYLLTAHHSRLATHHSLLTTRKYSTTHYPTTLT